MSKLYFQHHYSSLQCHMILQKLFWYADYQWWDQLLPPNIFLEPVILFSGIKSCKEQHLYKIEIFCNKFLQWLFINLTYPCWIKALITFKKNKIKYTDPKLLNGSVYCYKRLLFWINAVFFLLFIHQRILNSLSQVSKNIKQHWKIMCIFSQMLYMWLYLRNCL